jgi:hypothetical protein
MCNFAYFIVFDVLFQSFIIMAPRGKQSGALMNGKVTDSHSIDEKDAITEGEHYQERINLDKTELMNLQVEIKELSILLHTITALAIEVIQKK